jgi:hypothetical protein
MKDELKRRDVLKGLGASGVGSLAGCSSLLGKEAPSITERANQTEGRLKKELPWNEYRLGYNVDSIDLGKNRLGPTGVENASQYRVNIDIALSDNSDDLSGWLGTPERQREFFSLLNNTTYDMLLLTNENFSEFYPGTQPSNQNQVTEYRLHVDAETCSYLEDTVPVSRMNDILSSRSAYAEYVSDGEEYRINIEDGFLGTDFFC